MAGIRSAPSQVQGRGRRIALVAARFHEELTARLHDGAASTLAAHGVAESDIDTIWVPGAFELPLAAQLAAATAKYDAVVALGVVIQGGTDHYRHICSEAARGIMAAGLATGVPVLFGVLTCETREQAQARAGGADGNKGSEAALAALETIAALDAVRPPRPR